MNGKFCFFSQLLYHTFNYVQHQFFFCHGNKEWKNVCLSEENRHKLVSTENVLIEVNLQPPQKKTPHKNPHKKTPLHFSYAFTSERLGGNEVAVQTLLRKEVCNASEFFCFLFLLISFNPNYSHPPQMCLLCKNKDLREVIFSNLGNVIIILIK